MYDGRVWALVTVLENKTAAAARQEQSFMSHFLVG
jgi:hypothetical protein